MAITSAYRAFSPQAHTILEKRYLKRDASGQIIEDPDGMLWRVARAVASAETNFGASALEMEEWAGKFFHLMRSFDFLPNSPCLMNAGMNGTLSACYVVNINDSMESIMQAAHDQAMIEKYGGGVGFPLTNIRPRGSPISSTHGKACGPISVLRTLSQVGSMITQGGRRDGAHMATLSVYHPDIFEFVNCKKTEGQIHNFNISVCVDSGFMGAVEEDLFVHLTWPIDREIYSIAGDGLCYVSKTGLNMRDDGKFYRARNIFYDIVDNAWLNGEPGILFIDRINVDNTTPQFGEIQATNPCSEQPLQGNDNCTLGSINLGNFIGHDANVFDFPRFREVVSLAIRFLDDVVEINKHPTKATQEMGRINRKIGLGIMGWADLLLRLGIRYDSEEALRLAAEIGECLQTTADDLSCGLGKSRGSFPAFVGSTLNVVNGGKFDHMRNAWRLSIAPTGTISMLADCSSGIEPLFALAYKKHNMSAALEGTELYYINKDLLETLYGRYDGSLDVHEFLNNGGNIVDLLDESDRMRFRTANEISPEWHVRMQAVWQQYIDSGISKTINMPFEATKEDVYNMYMLAWKLKCKGLTVYRNGSRKEEVLVSLNNRSADKMDVRTHNVKVRPEIMNGSTMKVVTGHGTLYVTLNRGEDGLPFETFATLGKAGECEPAHLEGLCRMVSLALRSGIPVAEIIDQLRGIICCPIWDHGSRVLSLEDGVARALMVMTGYGAKDLGDSQAGPASDVQRTRNGLCRECGSSNIFMKDNCPTCGDCGYSKCS